MLVRCVTLLVLLVASATAHAETKLERLQKMHREMLDPIVLVKKGDKAAASGTLVYSRMHRSCIGGSLLQTLSRRCPDRSAVLETHTYALTNFHVVKHFLFEAPKTPLNAPDDVTDARAKRLATPLPFEVVVYTHGDTLDKFEQRVLDAEVVADDEGKDLALIRVDKRAGTLANVAALAPRGTVPLRADTAYSAGVAMKLKPFMRQGLFGGIYKKGENPQITIASVQTTADLFYGDSGGGLYHFSEERNRYELVGVSVAFLTAPHIAFSVSLSSVYEFLDQKSFGYIAEPQPAP